MTKTATSTVDGTVLTLGVMSLFSAGFYGAFGALIHYLYTVVKEEGKYSFVNMFVFVLMGFFIGILVDFITNDLFGQTYEGILLLSGFLVLRILDFLDTSGLTILLNRAGIKVPDGPNKKKK